ncbi:MAG: PAS domain-containing protein [Methanoregula sp.]|jgi:PAS domain S-box-containing protein|nr:PAS domain-containing protein [Methanoregula sp.]
MAVLDQNKVDTIKQHLRSHPRGLSISDLTAKLNVNRNLIAKYLDMLLISGQVEMETIGAAKVYFLSHRVPISAMLEFSSEYVIVLNAEQRVIQVNEPVLKLLNEKRDAFVGKKTSEIHNPLFSLLPTPYPVKVGEIASEKITDICSVINGKTLYFRAELVPTVFEDGSLGVTYIIEDITAKKMFEKNLKMSEARYRGIVEDQTEFITRFDSDGTLLFANESYARYLGNKPADLLGRYHIPRINDEGKILLNQAFMSLDKEHIVTTIECRVLDQSGRTRWNLWTIRALFDDEGIIREYQGVGRDTTEKKEAAARINNYIKNLEFLAQTSATFADMGDDENIYQYISDRIAELEPKAHVVVLSINPDTKKTAARAVAGDETFTKVMMQYFGDFVKGEVSMEKTPEAWVPLSKGVLIEIKESFYLQTYRMFPEHMCNEMEKHLSAGKSYVMGCTCRTGIYGNVAIRYRYDDNLKNRETVEAFVRQAGVALQRRYLREKLRKAEERIKVLESLPSSLGPEN